MEENMRSIAAIKGDNVASEARPIGRRLHSSCSAFVGLGFSWWEHLVADSSGAISRQPSRTAPFHRELPGSPGLAA